MSCMWTWWRAIGCGTPPNGRSTVLNRRTYCALRSLRRWFARWARWAWTGAVHGRKILIATVTKRAQAGLDASHTGLELSSLELTRLSPPQALLSEFDAVQSAFIGAETAKKYAQAFAESAIPQAQTEADTAAQSARAAGASELADARGSADAFQALNKEYRANVMVVRERLYRDAVERTLGKAGNVRWVPPPTGGSYKGFRIICRRARPVRDQPGPFAWPVEMMNNEHLG